jgi:hypothetical protein
MSRSKLFSDDEIKAKRLAAIANYKRVTRLSARMSGSFPNSEIEPDTDQPISHPLYGDARSVTVAEPLALVSLSLQPGIQFEKNVADDTKAVEVIKDIAAVDDTKAVEVIKDVDAADDAKVAEVIKDVAASDEKTDERMVPDPFQVRTGVTRRLNVGDKRPRAVVDADPSSSGSSSDSEEVSAEPRYSVGGKAPRNTISMKRPFIPEASNKITRSYLKQRVDSAPSSDNDATSSDEEDEKQVAPVVKKFKPLSAAGRTLVRKKESPAGAYDVEVICGYRTVQNEYLVIWTDKSSSWEPRENLVNCDFLIQMYQLLSSRLGRNRVLHDLKSRNSLIELWKETGAIVTGMNLIKGRVTARAFRT